MENPYQTTSVFQIKPVLPSEADILHLNSIWKMLKTHWMWRVHIIVTFFFGECDSGYVPVDENKLQVLSGAQRISNTPLKFTVPVVKCIMIAHLKLLGLGRE